MICTFFCDLSIYHYQIRLDNLDGQKFDPTKTKSKPKVNLNVKVSEVNEAEAFTGNAIVASLYSQNQNFDAILSTVTVGLPNGSLPVRALMDFGSQRSFIAEHLLENETYKILKSEVHINVKGINVSRSYKSMLIEMKVRFGDEEFLVNFFTLPSIEISLNIPKLSEVVSEFKRKQYVLADSFLAETSCSLNNIDILFGANACHCFEGNYIKFGNSMFMQTRFGVMLLGDVDRLLEDIKYLPRNNPSPTASFAINISDLGHNYGVQSSGSPAGQSSNPFDAQHANLHDAPSSDSNVSDSHLDDNWEIWQKIPRRN